MASSQTALQIALDRLTKLHPKLIDLGLERTLALSEKCGSPHQHLPPVIHIAGTNGKGSVSAFLASLYQAAGLRAHVYNSPHLCRFNERIRLAGQLISDAELVAILSEVEQINDGAPVTFFESTTIAAFLAFSRHPADILILETGLGGKFDSTNILEGKAVSVLTPIARDHEHFLGSDITQIAVQKAGIMRPNTPSIWARQSAEARKGLADTAQKLGGEILEEGVDFSAKPRTDASFDFIWRGQPIKMPAPSLIGAHQYQNAALALAAMKIASPQAFSAPAFQGIATAKWPGRIQELQAGTLKGRLGSGRRVWLDGAHNAHGAAALVTTLQALSPQKWMVIFGALDTRPAEAFLSQIQPIAAHIHTLTIADQPAAIEAAILAQTARGLNIPAQPVASPDAALKAIEAMSPPEMPVIICGSLYLAGQVLAQNDTLPD